MVLLHLNNTIISSDLCKSLRFVLLGYLLQQSLDCSYQLATYYSYQLATYYSYQLATYYSYQLATYSYCSYQLGYLLQLSVGYLLQLASGYLSHQIWVQVPVHLFIQPPHTGSNPDRSPTSRHVLNKGRFKSLLRATTYCSYQLATYCSYQLATYCSYQLAGYGVFL